MRACLLFALVLLSFAPCSLHPQSGGNGPYFSKLYGSYPDSDYHGKVFYADSGIFISGGKNILGEYTTTQLYRLDMEGNVVWHRRWGKPGYYTPPSHGVAVLFDSIIIVPSILYQTDSGNREILLTAWNTNGDSLWTREYPQFQYYFTGNIAATADGFAITGSKRRIDTFGLANDIVLIRFDATGNVLWDRIIQTPRREGGYSLAITPDGGFVIGAIGDSYGTKQHDMQALVVKTDSLGNVEWMKDFGGPWRDYWANVSVSSDSFILIATNIAIEPLFPNNPTSFDGLKKAFLAKLTLDGKVIWQRFFGIKSPGFTGFSGIVELQDGNYLAVGIHPDIRYYPIAWMVKLDTAGNVIWERFHRYYYAGAQGHYFLRAIELPDRSIVTGEMVIVNRGELKLDSISQDLWVVRTDSMGCLFAGCDTACSIPEIKYRMERIGELTVRLIVETPDITQWYLHLQELKVYPNVISLDSIIELTMTKYGDLEIILSIEGPCGLSNTLTDTIYIGPTSIEWNEGGDEIRLYPNPVQHTLTIALPEGVHHASAIITNISGQVVYTSPNISGTQTVSTTGWPAGIYLVQVATEAGLWHGKVMKVE